MSSPVNSHPPLPERPVLAILNAALEASDEVLRLEHPSADEWPRNPNTPASLVAAALLLARIEELRSLIAWYLYTVQSDRADNPF